jgi:hypothetical protein
MNDQEREFEDELEMFRTEVEQAKQFFYAYLGIDAEVREEKALFQLLNRAALLWNTIQYALQQSTFVALGRIFDPNPNVHGIARLMRLALTNATMFSKAALEQRKPGFPELLAAAHEPSSQQMRALRRDIQMWRQTFEKRYAPLRNRFYAHRERGLELGALLEGTTIEEIERMLAFLGSVYEALWQCTSMDKN